MQTDERLERVARAMCQADSQSPDEEVTSPHPESFVVQRHRGLGMGAECFGPRWETYHKEARRFLAAFDALNQ